MNSLQIPSKNSSKKSLKYSLFLIILLSTFFLKGVFLATLFPMFTGQDEARHYNIIQYINEPKELPEETIKRSHILNKENFSEYNFSEEIIKTGMAIGIDDIRHGLFDTQRFATKNVMGINETDITAMTWRPYNFYVPADVGSNSRSLYHRAGAIIEKLFSGYNILIRFYSVRIFSVLLGTIAVFLAFLIARTLGFSTYISTLFAALVAFQPKFSMYTTNINYDALLLPLFFLFTLSGVLSLRDGLNRKNISIMIVAVILGILTKGTAIILLVVFLGLIGFHIFKKAKSPKKMLFSLGIFAGILFFASFALETRYSILSLFPFKGSFSQTVTSLGEYLSTSLTPGRFALSSRTYWGSLGWNDDVVVNYLTTILWPLEIIAIIGLILFLFTKNKPDFLPEKKLVVFLITLIIMLQLGIRMADWNVFRALGSLDLGTPGRYFLPNLASHLILVFVGLGMILGKREYFKNILLAGVILMFFFSFYMTFSVVLPRFYL